MPAVHAKALLGTIRSIRTNNLVQAGIRRTEFFVLSAPIEIIWTTEIIFSPCSADGREVLISVNKDVITSYSIHYTKLYERDYKNLTAATSIYNLPYRRQGLAGRLTYDYQHRYLFEFNFGYNGSENFPKNQRYGFFPSGSVGWVISNESFWHVDFINRNNFV